MAEPAHKVLIPEDADPTVMATCEDPDANAAALYRVPSPLIKLIGSFNRIPFTGLSKTE